MGLARIRRRRAALVEFVLNGLHGAAKILIGSGPARRMDARRAAERIDRKPGIVGEGGQAGRLGGRFGLDAGVVAKAQPRLVRFLQSQFPRRCGVDPVRRKQLAHFSELAGVVGRDHEAPGKAAMEKSAHITAIFCRSISFATPLRARASSAANCSSENGVFSAVACTSTMLPEPVSTKLASVSACESSA